MYLKSYLTEMLDMMVNREWRNNERGKAPIKQPPAPAPRQEGRREGKQQAVEEGTMTREMKIAENQGGRRRDTPYRRLEMPIFVGYYPIGWTLRVERYFSMNGLTEQERLIATPICT